MHAGLGPSTILGSASPYLNSASPDPYAKRSWALNLQH